MIRLVVDGIRVLACLSVMVALAAPLPRPRPVPQTGARLMNDQVVLITGSTDGLGREVARRVAAAGAHVIVHGRNQERGTALVEEIAAGGKGSARFYAADFASLSAVGAFAQAIRRDYPRLHVLVNNAGVWLPDRQVSADGHEMHFAVNYLAGFLLTRTLLPLLVDSAPARIVNVASGAQSPIDFDDVMLQRPGRAAQGYAQSKLAQVMFTFDLARELQHTRVAVVSLHPATMMDTTMVRASGMRPQSSVDEGATAVMNLIVVPAVATGQFFDGLRVSRAHAQAYDDEARGKLRRLSAQLTGVE
jgi:NAD(P)-dependent dehydrogenase (short-subunit alcohol dehydrogenase family)